VEGSKTEEVRNMTFYFQVFSFKTFSEAEDKKNIRMKVKVSDGHYYAYMILVDKVFNSMVSALEENCVIEITGVVQISQAKTKYIVIPKSAPMVYKRGLKRMLGNPVEYDHSTEIIV